MGHYPYCRIYAWAYAWVMTTALTDVFGALADSTRLRLISLLVAAIGAAILTPAAVGNLRPGYAPINSLASRW